MVVEPGDYVDEGGSGKSQPPDISTLKLQDDAAAQTRAGATPTLGAETVEPEATPSGKCKLTFIPPPPPLPMVFFPLLYCV